MRDGYTVRRFGEIEARAIEQTPEGVLMRRASFAVAQRVLALLGEAYGRHVVLLVGSGNNGGDALWAGHFLRTRGAGVTAVLLSPERAHRVGLAALRRSGGRTVTADSAAAALCAADLVVDGIVGLSARGPLRPAAAELLAEVRAPIVAVDLPSGVDPETGAVDGPAVRAAATVTFQALKPAHVLGAGAVHSGRTEVVDIGIPCADPDFRLFEAADVAALLPLPCAEDDKYSQGVTGIAAGSAAYPGAAVLSASGAVRTSQGMVRYAGSSADAVRARWPEVVGSGTVTDAGRVQAWVVGPGLGTGDSARSVLTEVLAAGVPVLADADALTMIAADPTVLDARDPGTPLVLTPHAGEFARLAGDPGPDSIAAARAAAARYSATVLLKGHTTVIADPEGAVLVNPARGAWPATAGSGDVLSGIIGALLASGVAPAHAAAAGAYLHSLAAELAADGAPISASVLAAGIPGAIRSILGRERHE
ncbi:bifunctional ADP-dependent NAD(P)H-hydrate dehydratase/NAD(P)H-hydrate epimerase [Sciscionella marina]|uniref:bifunctional ADP-dependent NAD(P)H-hydrate dehydratase/NAD(P)H-hydrate epimerase n=1 Tax=Sciscionella marina TaxID=508770 RepID=UPI0003790C7B|nr:bifunctional ADP-dependent NAD(P)H-hydrate dehydratase/NAD(P)H-hydrate epimerase [Sciscionella marina]